MTQSLAELPEVVPASPAAVARAAELVRGGGVVAYPTETAYGLGVDGLDADAVARLARLKGRGGQQYFSLLVADEAMLARVVSRVSPAARPLIERHWPGPLTLVLPAHPALPPALVNPTGGVGVRISPDPVASALVAAAGRPLTATSANLTGQPAAEDGASAAIAGVDLVLDDGPRRGAVSTVVEVVGDRVVVLRPGPVEVGARP